MSDVSTSSDFERLRDDSKLECRICWHVYDPAAGDSDYQIPAGTPFSALPDYWRCPQCDGEPGNFLPIDD